MIRQFDRILATCGVTKGSLRPEERTALDEEGWVVLSEVVDSGRLAGLRDGFENAWGVEPEARQSGTRHVPDLTTVDPIFDGVYVHPRVLSAIHHVLGSPFEVLLFGGRDPLPGFGQQGLHNDWPTRSPGEAFSVATALWLLDDFTESNGATRVVSGSHLDPRPLPKSMQAPARHHANEVLVIAPAGSVLVLNGHLWHSGTKNRSKTSRRVLQVQYVTRGLGSPARRPRKLPERLSLGARFLLGEDA